MYAILLFLAAVGASFMLCAARGWALTSGPMRAASDLLFIIGVNNRDMKVLADSPSFKATYGFQKYLALAVLAGVVLACIPLYVAGGHTTAVLVILGTVLVCNTIPAVYHLCTWGFYSRIFEAQSSDSEFMDAGIAVMGADNCDESILENIPQDQILSVGKGSMLYISGLMIGKIGGYIALICLLLALWGSSFLM